MATRQYNVVLGESKPWQVTEAVGGAVSSGFLQVTADFDASPKPTRKDFLLAMQTVAELIYESDWDPA